MLRQPRDEWHVYGDYRPVGRAGHLRISNEYQSEETAWREAITRRLESEVCNLVIVHVSYRPHKLSAGHHRPVNTVIWRSGKGKAWFEP